MGNLGIFHKIHSVPFTNPPSDVRGTVFPPFSNVLPSTESNFPDGGGTMILIVFSKEHLAPMVVGVVEESSYRLAWRALFLSSLLWRPRPPFLLEVVRISQLNKCSFFFYTTTPNKIPMDFVKEFSDPARNFEVLHDMRGYGARSRLGKNSVSRHV